MDTDRVYDPAVAKIASTVPRFDVADAEGMRAVVKAFFEAAVEEGLERPTDDGIQEIERTIPGPDGAPDVPIRILYAQRPFPSRTGFCQLSRWRIHCGRFGIRARSLPGVSLHYVPGSLHTDALAHSMC